MLIVLDPRADLPAAERIAARARQSGYHACIVGEVPRLAVAVTGRVERPSRSLFEGDPLVAAIEDSANPYFLASRRYRSEDTHVDVGGVVVGASRVVVMAGPCAVESEDQLFAAAELVRKSGVSILRAGAYKPRTSPWSFQGLESSGLELLARVKRATGLRIVTEVVSERTLDAVAEVADLVQIGARNMKNYELLKQAGRCGRPVLLKRGADALVSEWLASAEYLLGAGCPGVILCERGIRTFTDHTRNTLDLAAIPVTKRLSHLPVIVDPSHGTGSRDLIVPLARAAIAVGADGLLVEVHPRPEAALSDGPQALRPLDFEQLVEQVARLAEAVGRKL